MKRTIKAWRSLFAVACLIVMTLSLTTFATEEDANVATEEVKTSFADYGVRFVDENGVVIGDTTTCYFEGQEVKPAIVIGTVTKDEAGNETIVEALVENTDYEISYADNANVGKAKVVIKGLGAYEGENAEVEFNIKADITKADVTLTKTEFIYSGAYNKPKAIVKIGDTEIPSENLMISYKNQKQVGTAEATITGTKYCEGTVVKPFKIVLGVPEIASATTTYNSISLTWNESDGASGYKVYRSTSPDKDFKLVYTSTSETKVSVKNTSGIKFNDTYYYKVRAYRTYNNETVESKYSPVVEVTVRTEAPEIKAADNQSPTKMKVSWKKVANASGYSVYRSTEEDGEYTRIGRANGIDNLSYVDEKCVCGATYFYKVASYRTVDDTRYEGVLSEAVSGQTQPATVKLGECSSKSTEVTVKWSKASGAQGYQIYRSENGKSGSYELIHEVESADTLKWTDKGLDKDLAYYYKVRAYCVYNDEKVKGDFSESYKKPGAGWKYKTINGQKYKLYYNGSGKLVKDVSNIIGKQSNYVVKVNKQRQTITVYAKDGSNGYIIPVKSFICSPGPNTPTGTYYTKWKGRWAVLQGPSYGQWCTKFTGQKLFHSVFYDQKDNKTLTVYAYNDLGTTCSHGCIRLTCEDARWIYQNCEVGMKVQIYNSSYSGPFGKPTALKIPDWHKWDPTDPYAQKYCKEKGCH